MRPDSSSGTGDRASRASRGLATAACPAQNPDPPTSVTVHSKSIVMPLAPGTLAPTFETAGLRTPRYAFNSVAGRPIVIAFLGPPGDRASLALLEAARRQRHRFDDRFASLFFLVASREELDAYGLSDTIPGVRCLMDPTRSIAISYGFATPAGDVAALPGLALLDRHLRTIRSSQGEACAREFEAGIAQIDEYSAWRARQRSLGHAPVLVVDRIFDARMCRALIEHYRSRGGKRSGFMRDVDGMTRGIYDDSFKRRYDCTIDDELLRAEARAAIGRRLRPLIRQAFNFDASRIERDIVACYDGAESGFFKPHRDNTTAATRHRRFAVTLNLNAEEYEGGDLRFPEFSDATYRAPTGGAVVFSGSLLHEATPVTDGVRYAYLPFLYGEEQARDRIEGAKFLDASGG